MGGRTSRPTITYSAPVINRSDVVTYKNKERGINIYNVESRLKQYNLSERLMAKIKIGLDCDYRFTSVNKFNFSICGDGRFRMSCYTFKVRKNSDGENEVEIKTNKLEYNVKATQEYETKGWGILFWYKRKYTQSRSLTSSEFNEIKKEMKQKIEQSLLAK